MFASFGKNLSGKEVKLILKLVFFCELILQLQRRDSILECTVFSVAYTANGKSWNLFGEKCSSRLYCFTEKRSRRLSSVMM